MEKPNAQEEYPGVIGSTVLVAAILACLLGAVYYLRKDDTVKALREMTGVEVPARLANPIKYASPIRVGDVLLFLVRSRKQDVHAMMDAKVAEVGPGMIRLVPDNKHYADLQITYSGLTPTISGNHVKCNDQVGVTEPSDQFSEEARLYVEIRRAGVVVPPINFPGK